MVNETAALRELLDMGFDRAEATRALERCNYQKEAAVQLLLSSPSLSSTVLSDRQNSWTPGLGVGLVDVGGSSYVNSLLQSYFAWPQLSKSVLSFCGSTPQSDTARVSVRLVERLQKLFAYLALSERRSIDPSPVLSMLRDDAGCDYLGKQVPIGDEGDVGEFNMWLISRIEDGLKDGLQRASEGVFLDFGTLHLRESFRPLSEAEMIDDGLVSKLFYGKLKEEVEYREQDGKVQSRDKEVLFAQFLVNADDSDLLTAWERSMSATITEYRTPENAVTSARQETWISRLPHALLFQINRQSNNKPFNFPEELFPDQFLHHNKALILELRQRSEKLQKRIKLLTRKLEEMEGFKNSKSSIERILGLSSNFLQDQITHQEYTVLDEERVQVFSPECVLALTELSIPQIKCTTSLLDSYVTKFKEMTAQYKARIQDYRARIQSLYDHPELKQHQYQLHACLVRDGQVGSGRYYSCVYFPDLRKWRKYCGPQVTEVSAEDVMKEASGGQGLTSGFCLIYIRSELAQGWASDSFSNYIPEDLQSEINHDNALLREESKERKLNAVYSQISETYSKRQNQALAQYTSYRNNPAVLRFDLVNFPVFMKIKGEEMLSRWVILDQCMIEMEPGHRSLRVLVKEPLGIKLFQQMKKGTQTPLSFQLKAGEEKKVKSLLLEFESNYKDAAMCEFIVKMMNLDDFKSAFFGISYMLGEVRGENTPYRTMVRDLTELLALRLCSEVNKSLFDFQLDAGLQHLGLVVTLASLYLDPKLLVSKQILRNLTVSYAWLKTNCSSFCPPPLLSKYFSYLTSLKSQDYTDFAFLDLDALVPGLEDAKIRTSMFSGYIWTEGWKSEKLANRLLSELRKLKEKYDPWQEMRSRLQSTRELLPDSMRERLEAKAGVRPS